MTLVSYPPSVSVLIPARNEEANLPLCLDTIIEQGAVVAEVLVYDDHSTDNTSQVVSNYVAQFSRISLIPPVILPSGWCGKNYACAQLAKQAKGNWLLFLDADTRLMPNSLNQMLNEAQARKLTFLSCWPKFQMETLTEKLLMPFLNYVVFSMFPGPLSFIKRPQFEFNPKLGLAHGACMLFERGAYEEFGGHEKVKDQIFEDTRIAQLWRASERRGNCLDGQEVVYLRMYTSFGEIWAGFQKNLFPAFQHEYKFWAFLLLHTTVYFLPFILTILVNSSLLNWSVLFITLIRVLLVIRFRHSLLSVLFHPLGELLFILLGLTSWWRCKYGNGVVWKGREYRNSQ